MNNYPAGAEHDPRAPYNQVEIEVTEQDRAAARETIMELSGDYLADFWFDLTQSPHDIGSYKWMEAVTKLLTFADERIEERALIEAENRLADSE